MIRGTLCVLAVCAALRAGAVDATQYDSLQAAVDANPGGVVVVEGAHSLEKRLRISGAGTTLAGHGTITQQNPAEPILEIEHAQDVRVETLVFARPALSAADENLGRNKAAGILINDARRVTLAGVTVRDAAARDAAVEIRASDSVTVQGCTVLNYQCLAVDDRTESPLYGYAFRCIDGTGILVNESTAVSLLDNRVVEESWLATRENMEKFRLGQLCDGRQPMRPGKLGEGAVRAGRVNNWHQGSAITVTGPEKTRQVIVRGNQIRNAAQGIDLHTDNTIVSGNIVDHGMIGIKLTHGARNLIVSDNLLIAIDLWGILLNPGAASHAADAERAPNPDGGTIIANNTITEFGRGHEYWNWGGANEEANGSYAIALYDGQLPENPPLRDVVLSGNVVYDSERELVPAGKPRYKFAVYVGSWHGPLEKSPNAPRDIVVRDNIFHPGRAGIASVDLATLAPK